VKGAVAPQIWEKKYFSGKHCVIFGQSPLCQHPCALHSERFHYRPMIVFKSNFIFLVPSGHKKYIHPCFQNVRGTGSPVPSKVTPPATHNKYLLEDRIMATVDMHGKFGKVRLVVFKICEQT